LKASHFTQNQEIQITFTESLLRPEKDYSDERLSGHCPLGLEEERE
jgi:hypothetical protein